MGPEVAAIPLSIQTAGLVGHGTSILALTTPGAFGAGLGFTAAQALQSAGAGFSALSSISAGRSAALGSDLQAELFRRDALRREQIAALNADEFARQERRRQARFRNLFIGGSGAEPSGTFTKVSQDAAAEAEFQRLKILSGGEAESTNLLSRAIFSEATGRAKQRQSRARAGSILLRGAGQLFGNA